MEKNRTSQELRNDFDRQNAWLENLGFVLRFFTLIGVIASIFFILNGITETKRQSEINQNYIRCIILLPASSFQGTIDQRANAIDDCAIQSKQPDKSITDISPLTNKTIATTGLIVSGVALVIGVYVNSRRLKALSHKVDDVHSEIKTGNSLSLAELGDAIESRRIAKIPLKDQTQEEKDHTRDVDTPK